MATTGVDGVKGVGVGGGRDGAVRDGGIGVVGGDEGGSKAEGGSVGPVSEAAGGGSGIKGDEYVPDGAMGDPGYEGSIVGPG